MPKRQVNVRLPEPHADRLAEISKVKGLSQADVLSWMIERVRWSEGKVDYTPAESLPPLTFEAKAPMSEFTGELAANVMKKVARGPIPITPSGPRPLLPPKGSCEHRSTRHDDAVGGRVCKHCGEIL